jgi:Cu2+-exporting ATPase
MLVLAIASFIYWYLAGNPDAYWIALSVLVVSCPCALSLAAPTANSVAQKRLKDIGIFIQSENTLEALADIRHICFDKTGTLTEGAIRIDAIDNKSKLSESQLLQIASILEASSHHPISHAFNKSNTLAENVLLINQQGIEGSIDGKRYRIGSPHFCQQWHNNAKQPASNDMLIGLCSAEDFIAWFHLQDPIRPNAKLLCEYMQANNFTLHILSGDSSNHVKSIAEALKIEHYYAGQSSDAKQDYVQALQSTGDKVLMLGDGINDAQVLAAADISATLFNASDWVRNTADIVFMQNDLQHLQLLFTAVKQHQKILRENYIWAFLYNGIAIPFAMAGFITPLLAAAGMSLSSVIVVLNSQRLKKARI